jgi:hypothetical protein
MLKGMIENFLPARQADKKRLTEVIQQNTAVLRQVSEGVSEGLLQDYKALHELSDKVTQELRSHSEHTHQEIGRVTDYAGRRCRVGESLLVGAILSPWFSRSLICFFSTS